MLDKLPNAQSKLGEKLREGVLNLWNEVNRLVSHADRHEKILAQQGKDIEALKTRITAFEREIHGLRISLGKTKSKRTKLEAQLHESEERLTEIKRALQ